MAAIEFRLKNIKSAEGLTATLAELVGSIDATTVESFASVMDKLLEKGVRYLVLDCAGIKYINSTGLGILLKYVDAFNERDGGIAFSQVPQKVMLVMEMLGFNALFTIVSDEAVALKHFSGAETPPVSVQVPADVGQPAPPAPAVAAAPAAAAPVAPPALTPAPAPAVAAPPMAGVFPLTVVCPRCQLGLKLPSAGRFKCPKCTSVVIAEDSGEMKFFASRRAKPIEVSLPAVPEFAGAVTSLVDGAARQVGFAADDASKLADAVASACKSVAEHACGNDPNAIFHMLIVPNGKQLTVKISDYGTPLDFPPQGVGGDARFASVADVLSVEHAQNPAGGNLFTLTKSVE
jgi:anti-sigma B factor antagonist